MLRGNRNVVTTGDPRRRTHVRGTSAGDGESGGFGVEECESNRPVGALDQWGLGPKARGLRPGL